MPGLLFPEDLADASEDRRPGSGAEVFYRTDPVIDRCFSVSLSDLRVTAKSIRTSALQSISRPIP
jgi:hypothetical protein